MPRQFHHLDFIGQFTTNILCQEKTTSCLMHQECVSVYRQTQAAYDQCKSRMFALLTYVEDAWPRDTTRNSPSNALYIFGFGEASLKKMPRAPNFDYHAAVALRRCCSQTHPWIARALILECRRVASVKLSLTSQTLAQPAASISLVLFPSLCSIHYVAVVKRRQHFCGSWHESSIIVNHSQISSQLFCYSGFLIIANCLHTRGHGHVPSPNTK